MHQPNCTCKVYRFPCSENVVVFGIFFVRWTLSLVEQIDMHIYFLINTSRKPSSIVRYEFEFILAFSVSVDILHRCVSAGMPSALLCL